MVRAQLFGGQLAFPGQIDPYAFGQVEPPSLSLRAVVDDLIALREEPGYLFDLERRYSPFLTANREETTSTVQSWLDKRLPALFLRAARQAEDGYLSARLAPYLERVRRHPGSGIFEVPGVPELAALALELLLRKGGVQLKDCEVCGYPFLASKRARFCRRRAPDSRQSCLEVGKVRKFRAERKLTTEEVARGETQEARSERARIKRELLDELLATTDDTEGEDDGN